MRFKISRATDNRNGAEVWAVYDSADPALRIMTVKACKADAEEDARCLNMASVVIA